MTIEEALSGNHSKEWKSAADFRYSSLIKNETWKIVKLPEGCKTVGCKWVFQVKYDGEGRIKCTRIHDEIFAPVAHLSSIRILLAFVVENKMEIHQMDIVSKVLNSKLKEEIFMQQPPSMYSQGK